MLAIWLTAGVLAQAGEAPPPPPVVPGIGGYAGLQSPFRLTPDEDERLERALQAADRAIRQARTPRVRRAKLGMAVKATEDALAIIGSVDRALPVMADLSEVHRILIDVRAGLLAFADQREALQAMVRDVMAAAAIEAESDEEEAFILLLLA
jgi:Mg2+/Co2+ transporter CorC